MPRLHSQLRKRLPPMYKAENDGGMLAIMLDDASAARLQNAVDQPEPDSHITLVLLSGAMSAEARRAVEEMASLTAPITGIISGMGRFTNTHKAGKDCLYASFDSPALPEVRQSLVNVLDDCGQAIKTTHGFTPHITLTYLPEGEATPTVELPELTLTFSALSLVEGDQRTDFPFQSGKSARPALRKGGYIVVPLKGLPPAKGQSAEDYWTPARFKQASDIINAAITTRVRVEAGGLIRAVSDRRTVGQIVFSYGYPVARLNDDALNSIASELPPLPARMPGEEYATVKFHLQRGLPAMQKTITYAVTEPVHGKVPANERILKEFEDYEAAQEFVKTQAAGKSIVAVRDGGVRFLVDSTGQPLDAAAFGHAVNTQNLAGQRDARGLVAEDKRYRREREDIAAADESSSLRKVADMEAWSAEAAKAETPALRKIARSMIDDLMDKFNAGLSEKDKNKLRRTSNIIPLLSTLDSIAANDQYEQALTRAAADTAQKIRTDITNLSHSAQQALDMARKDDSDKSVYILWIENMNRLAGKKFNQYFSGQGEKESFFDDIKRMGAWNAGEAKAEQASLRKARFMSKDRVRVKATGEVGVIVGGAMVDDRRGGRYSGVKVKFDNGGGGDFHDDDLEMVESRDAVARSQTASLRKDGAYNAGRAGRMVDELVSLSSAFNWGAGHNAADKDDRATLRRIDGLRSNIELGNYFEVADLWRGIPDGVRNALAGANARRFTQLVSTSSTRSDKAAPAPMQKRTALRERWVELSASQRQQYTAGFRSAADGKQETTDTLTEYGWLGYSDALDAADSGVPLTDLNARDLYDTTSESEEASVAREYKAAPASLRKGGWQWESFAGGAKAQYEGFTVVIKEGRLHNPGVGAREYRVIIRTSSPEVVHTETIEARTEKDARDAARRIAVAYVQQSKSAPAPMQKGYIAARKSADGKACVCLALDAAAAKALRACLPAEVKPLTGDLAIVLAELPEDVGNKLGTVTQGLQELAAATRQLAGSITGYGRLSIVGDPENDLLFAAFDAPGLADFRQGIVKALNAAAVSADMTAGFAPRVELATITATVSTPTLPLPDTAELVFDGLTFKAGGKATLFAFGETTKMAGLNEAAAILRKSGYGVMVNLNSSVEITQPSGARHTVAPEEAVRFAKAL